MTKFKLLIEAEIGLSEEAQDAWEEFSDLEKPEAVEAISKVIREALTRELEFQDHVINSMTLDYMEAK